MLRYYSEMDLERVAVYSPEDAEKVIDVPGWTYASHKNQPYTDKFNRGFQVLRGKVDGVIVVGSDDFLTKEYIEHVRELIKSGVDYAQPGALWFYDARSRRCIYGSVTRIGAGRMLSKRLLDHLGWYPYKAGLTSRLDHSMEDRVHPLVVPKRITMEEGRVLVDVKTDNNIWSFNNMKHLGQREDDPETFWREHFPTIADDIFAL